MLRRAVPAFRSDVADVDVHIGVLLEQGGDLWTDEERRRLLDSRRALQRLMEWEPPQQDVTPDVEGVELSLAAERGRDAMRALDELARSGPRLRFIDCP